MRAALLALALFVTSVAVAQPADKKPIAEVIARLSDADPKVRSNAAWSLGRHYADDPARLDPLEKVVLGDPESVVRSNALGALAPREVGRDARWRKLYLKVLTSDDNEHIRQMAMMHLRPIDPSMFDALVAAHAKDKSPRVRTEILGALVEAKMPRINDLLVKLVETDPDPGLAIGALAQSGDPRAIPALKVAAAKASPEYLNSAMNALAGIKDPAVDDILLEFLDGPKALDALRAAIAANRFDARQTPKLVKLWSSQDKAARKRSVSKLKAYENLEDDHQVHQITEQLRRIAGTDPSPCDARTAAKGELKTYLKKILPRACGTP